MTATCFAELGGQRFGCVVVDPPWKPDQTQRLSGRGRRSAAAVNRYSTLTPHQVADLPVASIAADQAHCWLWCTNGVLAAGAHRGILERWGFRAVTVLTWCKPGANGMGQYLRGATEHVVLGVKGWGTVPPTPWPSTWADDPDHGGHVLSPRLSHSVKTPAFGDIAERVSPGPYVELFARQLRAGWSSWGHGYELTREGASVTIPMNGDVKVHLPPMPEAITIEGARQALATLGLDLNHMESLHIEQGAFTVVYYLLNDRDRPVAAGNEPAKATIRFPFGHGEKPLSVTVNYPDGVGALDLSEAITQALEARKAAA